MAQLSFGVNSHSFPVKPEEQVQTPFLHVPCSLQTCLSPSWQYIGGGGGSGAGSGGGSMPAELFVKLEDPIQTRPGLLPFEWSNPTDIAPPDLSAAFE